MATWNRLRVFSEADGTGGNPLAVFLAGAAVPEGDRQDVAAALNLSETVFVDDREQGAVRIFTPREELPFAGHPLVGTSWLLRAHGTPVSVLRPPAGAVATWADDDGRTWIRGRAAWAPPFVLDELPSPEAVDALDGPPAGVGLYYAWAWLDEAAGVVRARMFGPAVGVPEDEATGSAATRLGAELRRELMIRQGRGSRLHVRPAPDDQVDVGGLVQLDGEAVYPEP